MSESPKLLANKCSEERMTQLEREIEVPLQEALEKGGCSLLAAYICLNLCYMRYSHYQRSFADLNGVQRSFVMVWKLSSAQ